MSLVRYTHAFYYYRLLSVVLVWKEGRCGGVGCTRHSHWSSHDIVLAVFPQQVSRHHLSLAYQWASNEHITQVILKPSRRPCYMFVCFIIPRFDIALFLFFTPSIPPPPPIRSCRRRIFVSAFPPRKVSKIKKKKKGRLFCTFRLTDRNALNVGNSLNLPLWTSLTAVIKLCYLNKIRHSSLP